MDYQNYEDYMREMLGYQNMQNQNYYNNYNNLDTNYDTNYNNYSPNYNTYSERRNYYEMPMTTTKPTITMPEMMPTPQVTTNVEVEINESLNTTEELEALYPETYTIMRPMITKVCDNNMNRKITEEVLEGMTREIYENMEAEDKQVVTAKTILKNGDVKNPNVKEPEPKSEKRQRNPFLRDLIRILILQELFRRRRRDHDRDRDRDIDRRPFSPRTAMPEPDYNQAFEQSAYTTNPSCRPAYEQRPYMTDSSYRPTFEPRTSIPETNYSSTFIPRPPMGRGYNGIC